MFHYKTHLVLGNGDAAAGKGFVGSEAVHKKSGTNTGCVQPVVINVKTVLIMYFVIYDMFAVLLSPCF